MDVGLNAKAKMDYIHHLLPYLLHWTYRGILFQHAKIEHFLFSDTLFLDFLTCKQFFLTLGTTEGTDGTKSMNFLEPRNYTEGCGNYGFLGNTDSTDSTESMDFWGNAEGTDGYGGEGRGTVDWQTFKARNGADAKNVLFALLKKSLFLGCHGFRSSRLTSSIGHDYYYHSPIHRKVFVEGTIYVMTPVAMFFMPSANENYYDCPQKYPYAC